MKTFSIVAITAAGVLGVAALAGGVAAAAATLSGHDQAGHDQARQGQSQPAEPRADGRPDRPGPGMGDHGPGMGDHGPGMGDHGPGRPEGVVLHGEMVVERPDGAVVTLRMQEGEATAVSATSITVRSTDGFTATYAITGETEQERGRSEDTQAQVGDAVHVRATVEGSTVTADDIHAMEPRA